MKIKTSELIDPALDYMVAVAQGDTPVFRLHTNSKGATIYRGAGFRENGYDFAPSVRGDTVIEIMERERIGFLPPDGHRGGEYRAFVFAPSQHDLTFDDATSHTMFGPTLRIAVCRAFVAAKLGDEVDVPEGLMK